MKHIAVIGLWHQGIVGAACLAEAGHSVRASGADEKVLAGLREGRAPLYEPGLDDMLQQGIDTGRLIFEDTLEEAVRGAELVMLMHDTPVDENDQSDLSVVFADLERIIPALEERVILYVTAQIPVGTCDKMADHIRNARPDLEFGIAYSPENLRLGQALERFRQPPLPVIGANREWVFERIESVWPDTDIQWEHVNLRTAEMVKHALNTFLATTVTFGNELGNLCDEVGADGHRVADVLRLEPRVGPKAMLKPGLGFAGGTLARDVQTLRGLGDRVEIETPLFDGLWLSNQQQNGLVERKLRKAFGGALKSRVVTVLGVTYKPDTSTLRRSAAIEVAQALYSAGATVRASDPKADRAELKAVAWLDFQEDPYEAARDADALVLMTPWKDYRALDAQRMADAMKGRTVLDTANLWEADSWIKAGFAYLDIGRGRVARDRSS